MRSDHLVLGTVQLGMSYGINNKTGKPDINGACDIVKAAFDNGITRFDTAQAYGDSEKVLGRAFGKIKASAHVKVYSKLHPGLDLSDEKAVRGSVEDSLRKLKIDRLEGLLLHNEDGLDLWDKGLGRILQSLVIQGKVKSIGVSFYTVQKAISALGAGSIELIQIPANILDQRFDEAGIFEKAHELNKQIFVRSVFLQGLLLAPLKHFPASMKYALPYLKRLDRMAADMKLNRQELALGYVAGKWPEAFILFGAETKTQVLDNVRAFCLKPAFEIDDDIFKNVPENVLNPVLWPKL